MEETYRIKAIILNRQAFRENDLMVTVYSSEKGKQSLIARGAKKFKSKAAAHLEPICLSEIMVVRGKQFDYVGSVINEIGFLGIKNSLDKMLIAGQALGMFNRLVKSGQADQDLYDFLLNYIIEVEQVSLKADNSMWAVFFLLKLLSHLGYQPDLYHCSVCGNRLSPGGSRINSKGNGLICKGCSFDKVALTLSDDCVKVLRLISEENFSKLNNLKISKKLVLETTSIINQISEIMIGEAYHEFHHTAL